MESQFKVSQWFPIVYEIQYKAEEPQRITFITSTIKPKSYTELLKEIVQESIDDIREVRKELREEYPNVYAGYV